MMTPPLPPYPKLLGRLLGYGTWLHLYDKPEEYVAVTEWVSGRTLRLCRQFGETWVGDNADWLEPENDGLGWRIARQQVPMASGKTYERLLEHPDVADKLGFYGKVYGRGIGDLAYGLRSEVRVAFFDILDLRTQKFLDYPEFLAVCGALKFPTAPCLFTGQFKDMDIETLLAGPTEVSDETPGPYGRAGVVVRQLLERPDPEYGRVCVEAWAHGR
jgi:hypothetical protein